MDSFLTPLTVVTSAPGKSILLGEHSVVYGYRAVAVGLPDLSLSVSLLAPEESPFISSWDDAWHVFVRGQLIVTEGRVRQLLTKALQKALSLCGVRTPLERFRPQRILVTSRLPLGGGVGGSAAMSLCLLRLAAQLDCAMYRHKSVFEQIESANSIDCLFHAGRASGLDVATVAYGGVIDFQKGRRPKHVSNARSFWLALVDSEERSETSLMVERVAERLSQSPNVVGGILAGLGELSLRSLKAIEAGCLDELAKNINQAQEYLCALGVSTPRLDSLVKVLREKGALAAKLTGAGGGGLVLALFAENPQHLIPLFSPDHLFITQVLAYEPGTASSYPQFHQAGTCPVDSSQKSHAD